MSRRLLEKRIEAYADADTIITSCPNCILQLRSSTKGKKIKHIVELVDEAVRGGK
jgi:Fe-S oxidoreductase